MLRVIFVEMEVFFSIFAIFFIQANGLTSDSDETLLPSNHSEASDSGRNELPSISYISCHLYFVSSILICFWLFWFDADTELGAQPRNKAKRTGGAPQNRESGDDNSTPLVCALLFVSFKS